MEIQNKAQNTGARHAPGPLAVAVEYDAYHPRPGIRVSYNRDTGFTKEQADALAHLIMLAPATAAELRALVDMCSRDVPRHACSGFDCATCGRPNVEAARALLARLEKEA